MLPAQIAQGGAGLVQVAAHGGGGDLEYVGDLGGGGAVVCPGHDLALPGWKVVKQRKHNVSAFQLVHVGVGSQQRGASGAVQVVDGVFADGGQMAGVKAGGNEPAPGVRVAQRRPPSERLGQSLLGAVRGIW